MQNLETRKEKSKTILCVPQNKQQEYLSLAMLFGVPLDIVKDNYGILSQQCKEAGII